MDLTLDDQGAEWVDRWGGVHRLERVDAAGGVPIDLEPQLRDVRMGNRLRSVLEIDTHLGECQSTARYADGELRGTRVARPARSILGGGGTVQAAEVFTVVQSSYTYRDPTCKAEFLDSSPIHKSWVISSDPLPDPMPGTEPGAAPGSVPGS